MCAIRVLIVEDDEDIGDLLQATLSPPHECLRAANGLEALQLVEFGEPDVILADIMMPVMDGFEFVKRLRADRQRGATPVIFLSALSAKDQIRKGYDLGATLYLTKPIDPPRLMRNLELFIKDHHVADAPKARTLEEIHRALTRDPARGRAEATPTARPPVVGVVQPDPATPSELRRQPGRRAKPRLLIVEDDPDSAEMILLGLQNDYEVVSAFDGMEAIERAARYKPDLFIVDGMLPKMTGYQLVGMLKRNRVFRDHPVIFISGKATVRDKQYVEKLGVRRFLPKPFDIAHLREVIAEIVAEPGFRIEPDRVNFAQIQMETIRDFETHRAETARSALRGHTASTPRPSRPQG